jgi:hypothetical protein
MSEPCVILKRITIKGPQRSWSLLESRDPAVIFSNGIGDHLLNLPALRALTALFPGRLTLICDKDAREIFFSDLLLRSVCEVDFQIREDGKIFDVESVVRAVGPCDLLISLNPWHSVSIDRFLEILAPPRSIGFFPAFHVTLKRDYRKHSAELAFDIPRFLDPSLQLDNFTAPPLFPPHHVYRAHRIRHVIPSDFRVMAVHADTQVEKMWPPTRFVSLLHTFLGHHPDFLVFIVGAKNMHLDSGGQSSDIIPWYGLSLPTAICLVAQADLFLGVDSCMLHAADLFRVPGVGLFGPTNCEEWGFRFGRGRHVCGNGSMENISESAVLQALESLLDDLSR